MWAQCPVIVALFVQLYCARGEECQERGRCLLCVGEGERITPTVEMSRNREVDRGAHEQQMAACQRGNTQEDSHCQNMPLNREI